MEHIKNIFDRLYKEPFPSEGGKEVLGVDLVMIDADTIGLSQCFVIKKGHLPADKIKILESCYKDLKLIIPHLDKKERQYFASLRHLAKEILSVVKGEKISDSEIERRHKWRSVYNQIKDVINTLDPLGVADIVDDEYDDLNFKIYSQLLVDRDDIKIRHLIQTMLKEHYGVTATENDLNETVNKLKSISLDN